MPLLRSSGPPSDSQRLADRFVLISLPIVGIVLGAWQAKECAEIRFGYVAWYAYATAVFLALALSIIGLLLLTYWRTRRLGAGLMLSGVLSCVSFYASMEVLLRSDLVAWRHEPPRVVFGPNVPASLVIYFKLGTTEKQVESFRSEVLSNSEGQHPSFVRMYLRFFPTQANGGHWGVALTFSDDARAEEVKEYVQKIEQDSRVDRVYRDTSLNAIQKPTKAKARKD